MSGKVMHALNCSKEKQSKTMHIKDPQMQTSGRRRRRCHLNCSDHYPLASAVSSSSSSRLDIDAAQRQKCDLNPSSIITVTNIAPTIIGCHMRLPKTRNLLANIWFCTLLLACLLDATSSSSSVQVPSAANSSAHHLADASKSHDLFTPSYLFAARNKSVNFTHVIVDESTNSIYLGATNWLFQLSASNLRAEVALRTGPANENSRDCAPADCSALIGQVDPLTLPLHHAHGSDLHVPPHTPAATARNPFARVPNFAHTMHTVNTSATLRPLGLSVRQLGGPQQAATPPQQQQLLQQHNNNYNKILALDHDNRQLIVCGSLNQGACRRHQLGQLANYSDLIPLPVAPNDEHSSTVALVTGGGGSRSNQQSQQQQQQQQQPTPVLYVAATNSRLGPYREMVPAISARYLEPASRAMQIIERSFTDSARVDISFELRDYYLVNYVHAFQHNDYVYFATVQRRSPLRQLEEWGYITRLARLCLSDLSFQSYAELTLECRSASSSSSSTADNQVSAGNKVNIRLQQQQQQQQHNQGVNYNLLQDAQLTSAGSHLAHQLGVRPQSQVLVTAFAQSKDHTTKSQTRSAICLFPMDKIEQKFQENIHMCYNGSSRARNMNYIAGSVNDCPKAGRAANIANFCNEPIKLNGSLPLVASPVIAYDNELLTSVVATQANTAPLTGGQSAQVKRREHQVIVAGTSDGQLKRIVLLAGERGFGVTGHEFHSVSLDPQHGEPILADMHLLPARNPQVHAATGGESVVAQHVLAATPSRVVKLRVNGCARNLRDKPQLAPTTTRNNDTDTTATPSLQEAAECGACAQLQDPFCGWCASSSACTTMDECARAPGATSPHWSPFDQIKCQDYRPLAPTHIALQAAAGANQHVDVNVRLTSGGRHLSADAMHQVGQRLAHAQFQCHFDYLSRATNSNSNRTAHSHSLSGATTKAAQARLNLHTNTVAIGCPLPAPARRPKSPLADGQLRVRLSVRLLQEAASGAAAAGKGNGAEGEGATTSQPLDQWLAQPVAAATDGGEIERELTLFDCSAFADCHSCLGRRPNAFTCAWCPLTNRCTFNATHPEFGCAASAVTSTTTPHSLAELASPSGPNLVRASHLTASLDRAQVSVFGLALERAAQCPAATVSDEQAPTGQSADELQLITTATSSSSNSNSGKHSKQQQQQELLIPNNSRRSLQVTLSAGAMASVQQSAKSVVVGRHSAKLECLLELEGARFRLAARATHDAQVVTCQESSFSYQDEISTQRARLFVILNDNQVIDSTDVILYKCHLFGVNPPALTSTVGGSVHTPHSSAAWPRTGAAHELLQHLHLATTTQPPLPNGSSSGSNNNNNNINNNNSNLAQRHGHSDCSLCANVERKYQCAWCGHQCRHTEQCAELQASTCPPPRIDSVRPATGPLEGGTLVTIEGSNLGSNEREIQDKISVGGEPCQLVMYSVSTRIVCKTGQSLHGPQAATVFVGNRAGVTSAHEKFHYKAVHLTDVTPNQGPASGGTRLYLKGANLNVGSRVQIFLDDIPCSLDSGNDISSNQLTCVTAPNSMAAPMRITRLTLMIDNSTHHLPYPFTYQPDPIITSIEPAESFLAGGRLVLVTGQHLQSPQTVKLMVYHEHRQNIVNSTTCITQNDTLVTCLTPGVSRDMLASLAASGSSSTNGDLIGSDSLANLPASYEAGGLRLKMSLYMDDVRSVRNLDEYYHHLPHYITYFDDPQLFRLAQPIIVYREELIIQGENLKMKQLDQDMLITIGARTSCLLKSIGANQIVCEPPREIEPVYDHETGRLLDRPLLPIIGLIGSHLRFQIGHMQYSSSQYRRPLPTDHLPFNVNHHSASNAPPFSYYPSTAAGSSVLTGTASDSTDTSSSPNLSILVSLSGTGFIIGLAASFVVAISRFRQAKAEREYKRIQLQMGSLDANGQPFIGSGLFGDNLHSFHGTSRSPRALDYVSGALAASKKPFYQLTNQRLPSFPPSPLTDISSLTSGNNQQHLIKLSSNGTIINSTMNPNNNSQLISSEGSSQSSPGSARNTNSCNGGPLFAGQNNGANNNFSLIHHQQVQSHQVSELGKSNLLSSGLQVCASNNGNSNFVNRIQEAPCTIVPYAVIEACNLTLEGKNAMKDYV